VNWKKHESSLLTVVSDAGSTPAASTIFHKIFVGCCQTGVPVGASQALRGAPHSVDPRNFRGDAGLQETFRTKLLEDRMVRWRDIVMTLPSLRNFVPVACGLVLIGCAPCMVAQEEAPPVQAPTTTLHVTSRLVVVDVVVLDKAGHPVSNLNQSDFSITENKVPQKIRSFDAPSGHAMPAGSAEHPIVNSTADLAKIGNAPVNILVFDELNTKWDATAIARQQMERYLKAQPEILKVPTLLVAAGDSRFTVLHDYTQSRADLLEAIRTHFPSLPSQMMRGGSNSSIDLLEQTLGTLSEITESTRGTRGRKNIIWVGSGYASLDTTTLTAEDEASLLDVIHRVTARMLAARVTLYMVDPAGVATGGTEDEGTPADDDGAAVTGIGKFGPYAGSLDFGSFAGATGGEIFSNRNDINVAIGQSIQDGGVYYTLSYVPTDPSDDAAKYRQIRVKVKTPGLHAVTRDGYFPATEEVDRIPVGKKEKPDNQLQFDIMSAARTRLVYNGLAVSAKASHDGYTLLVGARNLHWDDQPDGSRIAEVTVMAVCFNGKDKELQSNSVEKKEKIGAGALNDASVLAIKVPLDPPLKAERVRFVVRDAATGVLGTADASLDGH
jgi:VWFA-related protein